MGAYANLCYQKQPKMMRKEMFNKQLGSLEDIFGSS